MPRAPLPPLTGLHALGHRPSRPTHGATRVPDRRRPRDAPAAGVDVRLLAARLYWGARPPAYPSTARAARGPAPDGHLLRARLPRPAALPRHADPLGPRARLGGHDVQHPDRLGRGRDDGAAPGRLPPRPLQPADALHRAVQRRRRRPPQLPGRVELDPLPRHPGWPPWSTSSGTTWASGTPTAWSAARTAAASPLGGTLPARGVRRQLGRDGPLDGLLLRCRCWPGSAGPARSRTSGARAPSGSPTSSTRGRPTRPCGSGRDGTTYWVEYQPEHSPVSRAHDPRRDDPSAGRRRAGRARRRVAGQPDRHRLPRRRPDQPRTPGGQQPDHAGAHPDHHGRDRAARQGARRVRPDHRGPRRSRRPVRCPGGWRWLPGPLGRAGRQRADRPRLPGDGAAEREVHLRTQPGGLPHLGARPARQERDRAHDVHRAGAEPGRLVRAQRPADAERCTARTSRSRPRRQREASPAGSRDLRGDPDSHTHSPPTSAWAEVGSVACTSEDGSGPYDLMCARAPRQADPHRARRQRLRRDDRRHDDGPVRRH